LVVDRSSALCRFSQSYMSFDSVTQAFPNFFVRGPQAIPQQFEISYVMRFFRDMLHSTNQRIFHKYNFFIIDEMSLRPDEMASRSAV